jgi:predicted nucleic acid-binding protein
LKPGATRPARGVLDTNVVLDLLVFGDPVAAPLQAALTAGHLDWLATAAMRDELERVLAYGHITARLASSGRMAVDVLRDFDRLARIVEAPVRAPVTCGDPDDQKFVDLAVRHECLLLSRDAAVLALAKKLALLRVDVIVALPPAAQVLP